MQTSWAWLKTVFLVDSNRYHEAFFFRDEEGYNEEGQSPDSARELYAQITRHAVKVQLHQHRNFLYAVYIWRQWARLMRWDRAGVVVSEPFNWLKDPEPILTLVYTLANGGLEAQGYDVSAQLATEAEVAVLRKMRTQAQAGTEATNKSRREFLKEMLADCSKWPIYKVRLCSRQRGMC